VATLFRRVKTALQDLDSIENDTETGTGTELESDSMDAVASTELLDKLECLANKAETDLQGKSSNTTVFYMEQAC
jgi:ubiquitin carboxyl-terminal hydrolase 25/28